MVKGEALSGGGLYTGFEHYRILGASDISAALRDGMVALDTNVLLNLYRYNDQTVDDLLRVANAVRDRLFIPHQVVREFWRNRKSVIASLGGASKEAQSALIKNTGSTKDAVTRWAKSVAIPDAERDALVDQIDTFFAALRNRIGSEPVRVATHTPTDKDPLLAKVEALIDGAVGDPFSNEDWLAAVAEGERRVANSIPPGYMDVDKLESDLPEGASGDYIVWAQILAEAVERQVDCVLITADTKEDWWNRGERGIAIGPRRELVEEYFSLTGRRIYLLEPADMVRHSAVLDVETSAETVDDIERVRDDPRDWQPWTQDSVNAVLSELDAQGHVQAEVIREAIRSGGRISRARVYEIDGRDTDQMLRGFTRPVQRVTGELQAADVVPMDLEPLFFAVYETGVSASHFAVPVEVVDLFTAASARESTR